MGQFRFSSLLQLLLLLSIFGCSNFKLKTRDQISKAPTPVKSAVAPREEVLVVEEAPDDAPETSPTETPAPVLKKVEKIGIILGPGGALSWAHIGFLQELAKEKIPVAAIVGVEWGAVVAAAYADKGSVNQAEWELSKLKNEEVVKKNLLGKTVTNRQSSELAGFLNEAFSRRKMEQAQIPFGCPTLNIQTSQSLIYSRGSTVQGLSHCLSYPPMFSSSGNIISGTREIKQMSDFLKSRGAEKIVLINLLDAASSAEWMKSLGVSDQILWAELTALYSRPLAGIDFQYSLKLNDLSYFQFDNGREILNRGATLAAPMVKDLAKKIGSE